MTRALPLRSPLPPADPVSPFSLPSFPGPHSQELCGLEEASAPLIGPRPRSSVSQPSRGGSRSGSNQDQVPSLAAAPGLAGGAGQELWGPDRLLGWWGIRCWGQQSLAPHHLARAARGPPFLAGAHRGGPSTLHGPHPAAVRPLRYPPG